MSYGRDFYTPIGLTPEAAVRRAVVSHGRRRLVQRRLLLELVGEGVSYEQYFEDRIFVERTEGLRPRQRRRLLASLINLLVLAI